MERAIEIYQELKVFDRPRGPAKKGQPAFPDDADRAVRQVGELYLNALSDPVRAKRAFMRLLRYATTEEDQVRAEIDLVRVDRRAGDLQSASERASRVADRAEKAGLRELYLSAVIEGANVAWYQGNYRLGGVLCQKSLSLADELIAAEKKESLLPPPKAGATSVRKLSKKNLESSKIFALSVCGVIAMSQRSFEQATKHLERARRIASRNKLEREEATQYNNLGRLFLEFGKVDQAIGAFLSAKTIDEKFRDRYSLAYDLRNLGNAHAAKKSWSTAEELLTVALRYASEAKDTNNELRARFALAEVAMGSGKSAQAITAYREALPLADRLGVKELAWQIHRGLGLLAADPATKEKELRHAVRIARSISGRSAPSDFGPDRYAAYDDLIVFLAAAGRADEAFEIASQARALEQFELLEDDRLTWASSDVPALLAELRTTATATGADAIWARLEKVEPRLVEILRPAKVDELTRGLAPDAAILGYRVLPDRVLIFWIAAGRLEMLESKIEDKALKALLAEYGRQMSLRAEPTEAHAQLAALLIAPIAKKLEGVKRLAIVPHEILRYVAFAALPIGEEVLLDRVVLVEALDPRSARRALDDTRPLDAAIVALGAANQAPGSSDPPLPFAKKELSLVAEEEPSAKILTGAAVTKDALLGALKDQRGIFHFAGHAYLAGPEARGRFVDPLGGQLRTSDQPVTMLDVFGARNHAELIVLSACSSLIWPKKGTGSSGGEELLSMAQTFQLAGSRRVLATTLHVHDLAASLVMKHFYRAQKRTDVASALREAQLKVKKAYPHPAWWASFVLLGG
jgi:CHAT domain-containing protein